METEQTTLPNEINSYEEYLRIFFPKFEQTKTNIPTTAKEIGIVMAKETLSHIQRLLAENRTA